MQYLVICEGPNEKAIIEMLIDANKLIIGKKDLLNREVFISRQIYNTPQIKTALKTYNNKIEIWRIGDTLKDALRIPEEFKQYIDKDRIRKFCTKPEIEMLLIINNNLFKEYNKVKSSICPKDFAKSNIKLRNTRYNNKTDFWKEYYKNKFNQLVDDIREYKHKKKNNKLNKEEYLADILK